MACIGKSCLAMEVVQNRDLMKNSFNYRVFWINPGVKPTENDLILCLMKLFQNVTFKNKTYSDSKQKQINRQSMGSIDTLDMIKDRLRQEFIRDPIREALIILDEVHSKNVIEAFDLGCKILVTTRDKTIVPKSGNYFIEVIFHHF